MTPTIALTSQSGKYAPNSAKDGAPREVQPASGMAGARMAATRSGVVFLMR
ncbi:hypothetical protein KGP87_03185 [Burkholderia multivorans]|nr:hypothetical protein [Burkholderia multivorans]